jgi:DNA-directed RNA polymerase alpha subunit
VWKKALIELKAKLIEQEYLKDYRQEKGRVESLEFNTRITNALLRAGIYTTVDLIATYNMPGKFIRIRIY